MNRQLVFYKEHFIDFYKGLEPKVRDKIQYVFELIKQVEKSS